jgi:NitT/TauT family transport system ATP-binding protein
MDSAETSRQVKIVIENAVKYYQTKTGFVHALQEFTADIYQGELICILGPSGCGKSTLLWAMGGLHELSKGRILIDGEEVKGPRSDTGMIFQDPNLLPWRNLKKNMMFPVEIKRLNKKQYEPRIMSLLEMVGLTDFIDRYPRELSSGMQQRASIVRGLLCDPGVLLMDEPFGALDCFTRDEMDLLIMKLWAETKKTIVFVTHNISEAIFLADRVFVSTPRPGRLSKIFKISLPRPRTVDMVNSDEFIELVNAIKETIAEGEEVANYYEVS